MMAPNLARSMLRFSYVLYPDHVPKMMVNYRTRTLVVHEDAAYGRETSSLRMADVHIAATGSGRDGDGSGGGGGGGGFSPCVMWRHGGRDVYTGCEGEPLEATVYEAGEEGTGGSGLVRFFRQEHGFPTEFSFLVEWSARESDRWRQDDLLSISQKRGS